MAGDQNPKVSIASPRTPGGRTTAVLVPQGALAGQPDVPLDRPVTTVGSNENARLHLISRTVSKGHAIFVNSGGATYVADMASRTGVLVNGKLVKDAELKTGDRVQIGKFVFRYRSPANVAPPPPQPESPPASVIVVGKPGVPVRGRTVIIGRRETSDIAVPNDAGVSAAHAVIFQMDGRWYIRDLASRTGTQVNGSPIHQQELKFGTRITVGSTNILFQPGVAKVDDLEDSFAPQIPAETEAETSGENPLEEMAGFESQVVAAPEPTPVAADELDDAIPLGDDWRSVMAAQPQETPVEAAVDEELQAEPETPAAAEPVVEALPFADELSLEESAADQPVAVGEPVEVQPAVTETADAVDNFDLLDEEAAAAVEPVVKAHSEERAAVAEPPVASVPGVIEAPAAPVAEAAALPVEIETAAVAREEEDSIEFSLPLAEEPAPEPEPIPEPVAKVEETIASVEPPATPPPSPRPQPVTAAAPGAPAPLAYEHLLGEVDDFVFVPTAEKVDPNAVPDVIFWGDPELDSIAEQVVTKAPTPPSAPPAVSKTPPPSDREPPADGGGPSAPPPPPRPISPSDSTASNVAPSVDHSDVPPVAKQAEFSSADVLSRHSHESAAVALEEPVVEADDDFIVPMSEGLGAEFQAARDLMDAAPDVEVAAFDVPNAVEFETSADLETSLDSTAVELLEPPAGHTDLDAMADLDTTIATAPQTSDISAIVNADLESPIQAIFSAAGAPEAAAKNFELPGFEDVELDRMVAAPPDYLEVALDEPQLDLNGTAWPAASATASAMHFPKVESATVEATYPVDISAVTNAELVSPELEPDAIATKIHFPMVEPAAVETAEPGDFSAVVNAELDEWFEAAGSQDEEPIATFEDVEIPGFTDVEIVPLADENAGQIGTEAIESSIVKSDETPGFGEIHADAEAIDWGTVVAEKVAPVDSAVLEAVAVEELAEVEGHLFETRFHPGPSDSAVQASLPLNTISALAFNDPAPVDDAAVTAMDEIDRGDYPIPQGEAAAVETADHAASTITGTPHTTDFAGVVSSHAEAPVDESVTLSERQLPPVESEAVEAPHESNESDLEFMEFGEAEEAEPVAEAPAVAETPAAKLPAAKLPVVEKPAAEQPKAPEPAPEKPAAPAAPRRGPSLFGFEFEGGSFLGGMPISLADKSAIPPRPKVVPPPVPSPALSPSFDVRATPPSGLGAMQAPVAPPAPAALPVVPATTPPRPTLRPPPSPQAARAATPVPSLTGLVSEARSTSGPPVIPPVVKGPPAASIVVPGLGLTGAAPAQALGTRSVEVFSQLSAPIGVEVFGGRPGNPDQFVVPDIKDTTEPIAVDEEPATEEEPAQANEDATVAAPVPKVRWSRIPLWVSLMVIVPACAWLTVPHVIKESSTFTGQLSFAGLKELKEQRPEEYHEFIESQKALLLGGKSEDVRLAAKAILLKDRHPPGFTADSAQFAQAVQTQNLTFVDDRVEFTLAWPGEVMASAQVDAVLLALAENDHGLEDAKQRALLDADAAKANLAAVNAKRAKLKTEFDALAEKAANKPDTLGVSQNQQDVIGLTDQYNAALAQRTASESVLKELKSEDPSKPIDPDTDKETQDYKRRLDLLNEQIRIAKSKAVTANSGAGVGTDVSVAATTQPDSSEDFLLATLQSQADMWAGKIQRRRDELAVEAAIPAAQRAVNLESAIEKLSIKINGLQTTENDLKARLDQAKETAAKFQAQKEAADLAEAQKNEHYTEIQKADAEQQQAANTAAFKELAYENCITVAGQTPARFVSETNFRRIAVLVVSILAWILFGRLTVGELLRPKLVKGIRPAAAPRGGSPMRVIPWPQPHQLQGLQTGGTEPHMTADAGL